MAETRGDICQSQAVIERMENVGRSELGGYVWPMYGSDTTDFGRAWQSKRSLWTVCPKAFKWEIVGLKTFGQLFCMQVACNLLFTFGQNKKHANEQLISTPTF